MGRKKGSKNSQAQNASSESVQLVQAEANVTGLSVEVPDVKDPSSEVSGNSNMSSAPTPVQPASDFGDNNRAAIYEEYRKANEAQEVVTPVETESESFSDIKSDGETGSESKTGTSPEVEVTGDQYTPESDGNSTGSEIEKGDEGTVTKDDKKEAVVPYDALHAEREKRKDIQTKLDEVLQAYKALEESKSKDTIDDSLDYLDDEQSDAFKKLRSENKELKDAITRVESRFVEEDQAKFNRKISTDVDSVDKVLVAEGFPGFKDFGQNLVVQRLNELAAEKGEEEAQIYRNPEGWKMIWKELFPKVNSVFSGQNKSETFDKKKDLKVGARLAGSPGQATKEEKKTDEWTYDDYLKSRAASAA